MDELQPSIALVIPSFQQGRYLEDCLDSVLGQRYPALECLVVDGGSQDQSPAVIRRYADRLAWWCSEPDAGQAQAINKGLRRCTAEVVGWLNSDDLLLPGALAAVGRALADPAVPAVCGWGVLFGDDGRIVRRETFPQPTQAALLRRPLLFQPAVFWRRNWLDRVGLLDEGLHFCMDLDYWVRLAQAGCVPRLVPRFLAGFRLHPGQKTQRLAQLGLAEARAIFARVHGPAGTDLAALGRSLPWSWRMSWRLYQWWHRGLAANLPPYPRGGCLRGAGPARVTEGVRPSASVSMAPP